MDSPTPDRLGEIYESIQPQMAAQKRAYLKARFGVALAAPLLLVGGAVYAANADSTVSSVAHQGNDFVAAPELDDELGQDEVPENEAPATLEQDEATDGKPEDEVAKNQDLPQEELDVELAPPADDAEAVQWQTVSLGLAGSAEVGIEDVKHLTLGDLDLNDGWEAVEIKGKDRYIVLQLTNGEVKLLVTLKVKVKTGDMKVKFEDLAPEPVEDEKVPEAPKAAPKAAVDGTSYSSDGGSVFVSSNGSTVSISVTGTTAGWTATTVANHGPYAKVQFTNGETYIYVMGKLEGSKLVVGHWVENHAPLYGDGSEKDKKHKG